MSAWRGCWKGGWDGTEMVRWRQRGDYGDPNSALPGPVGVGEDKAGQKEAEAKADGEAFLFLTNFLKSNSMNYMKGAEQELK